MQLELSILGFSFDFNYAGSGRHHSRNLLSSGSGGRELLGIADFFSILAAGSFSEALEKLYEAVKKMISDIISAFANIPGTLHYPFQGHFFFFFFFLSVSLNHAAGPRFEFRAEVRFNIRINFK